MSAKITWLALAACLAAACGDEMPSGDVAAPREPAGGTSSGSASGGATYSGGVQPVLMQYCSPCHNAQSMTAGLDLTSYAAMQAFPGLIVPGNPGGSLLLQMLESGTMPPAGRPRPSAAQIADIHAWVAAGALND